MSLAAAKVNLSRLDRRLVEELMAQFKPPQPEIVRHHRQQLGLKQQEAAAMVGLSHGSRWAEFEAGTRPIDAARWELFLLKTSSHPKFATTFKSSLPEPSSSGGQSSGDGVPSRTPAVSQMSPQSLSPLRVVSDSGGERIVMARTEPRVSTPVAPLLRPALAASSHH